MKNRIYSFMALIGIFIGSSSLSAMEDQGESKKGKTILCTLDDQNIEINDGLEHFSTTLHNLITNLSNTDELIPVDLTSNQIRIFLEITQNLLSLYDEQQRFQQISELKTYNQEYIELQQRIHSEQETLQKYDLEALIQCAIVVSYFDIQSLYKPLHKAIAKVSNQIIDNFLSDHDFSHIEILLKLLKQLPYNPDLNRYVLADILHPLLIQKNFIKRNPDFSHKVHRLLAGTDPFYPDQLPLFDSDETLEPKVQAKPVYSGIFSPDGLSFLVHSNKTVALCSTTTGSLLHAFTYDPIKSAIFSPDGSTILICSDNVNFLFNASTGELIHTFSHNFQLGSAVFSPDNSTILTYSRDHICLWNSSSGELIHTFLPDFLVESAVFSPDGSTILFCLDTSAQLWNASSKGLIHTLGHRQVQLKSSTFSPNGLIILTHSYANDAHLWNTSTGELVHTLKHDDPVLTAIFSPNSSIILTSTENNVYLWDTSTGSLLKTFSCNDPIISACFNHDGSVILTCSRYDTYFWDISTGTLLNTIFSPSAWIDSAVLSHDSSTVLICFANESSTMSIHIATINQEELKPVLDQLSLEQIILLKIYYKAFKQEKLLDLQDYPLFVTLYNQCDPKIQLLLDTITHQKKMCFLKPLQQTLVAVGLLALPYASSYCADYFTKK